MALLPGRECLIILGINFSRTVKTKTSNLKTLGGPSGFLQLYLLLTKSLDMLTSIRFLGLERTKNYKMPVRSTISACLSGLDLSIYADSVVHLLNISLTHT